MPLSPESGLYAGLWADGVPALRADKDGIVGRAIGHLENGTPAFIALHLDASGNLRHGNYPQPIVTTV